MSRRLPFRGIGLVLLSVATAWAGMSAPPVSAQVVNVTGEVKLFAGSSQRLVKDASHVVIWLVPMRPEEPLAPSRPHPPYRMLQHGKRFEPSLLVVPVGSVVAFPNLDPWFHNVFSLFRGQRFDLGLYPAGTDREVRFNHSGVSYLFCNIHPQMEAVILSVDSNLFGISDPTGRVSIAGVPAGQYWMHVWYGNATADALRALDRVLSVSGAELALPPIVIAVKKQTHLAHQNLYGADYAPPALDRTY